MCFDYMEPSSSPIYYPYSLAAAQNVVAPAQDAVAPAQDVVEPAEAPLNTVSAETITDQLEFNRHDTAALSHEDAVALPYYM